MLDVNIDNFIAQRFYDNFLPEISALQIYRNSNRLQAFNVVTTELLLNSKNKVYGAGGSFSSIKTIISSIGEGVERLCLHTPPQNLRYDSYENISEEAINPLLLYGYDENVYDRLNINKYCPRTATMWKKCKSLLNEQQKFIPACSIWTNFSEIVTDVPIWDRPVSTGTASHFDKNKSILSGVLEVIERDTFSLYWENKISGVPRDLSEKVKDLQNYLKANCLESEIIYLPNEFGVPVACCLIEDKTGYGSLAAFGAAAKLSWDEAALRAIEEAILTHLWLTSRMKEQPKSYEYLISQLSALPDPVVHADIYGNYQMKEHYLSLFDMCNTYTRKVDEVSNYKQLLERITSQGYEIYIADITLPEFSDMGYVVNRVMIPGLVPLSRGFFLRHTTNSRHTNFLNDCVFTNHSNSNYFVQPLP